MKMKNLKTFLIIAGLVISSCSQHPLPSVSEILKDKAMEDSIMTKISNDPQLMSYMMDHIRGNEHAMQMIQNNQVMQNGQMQKMINMTRADSSIVRCLFNVMVQNPVMMSLMMNMMAQNSQSMKMMQNKLQEKGMMNGKDMAH